MIRGVEFISKIQIDVLKYALKDIDLSRYNWTSENFEGYSALSKTGCDPRFLPNLIAGEDFQEGVFSEPEYSFFFAEFKGFSKNGQIVEINTFEEFKKSDCRIMVLINDGMIVEVYAKDSAVLEAVYKNAQQSGQCTELIYKTDENDCRTRMHVW